MKKIIVTGGSGFIGSNLIAHLLKRGCQIVQIDLKNTNNPTIENLLYHANINDFEKIVSIFKSFEPDIVIHLAARTDLAGKNIDAYSVNTKGTENIIKACNATPSVKRVIFTSSMLVCKPGYIPLNATDYAPSTVYGESKVEMERIIRREKLNFEWAIVRPTSIWGPGFGVPYRNFFDMVISQRYFHFGKSASTKTYGYIGNAIHQIDSILNAPKETIQDQVFYLGDYEPTNIKTWADEIGAELGMKIKTIPFPVIKLAARFGDLLKQMGVNFPMTSFRLKNMTTDNIVDLTNTREIAPKLPFTRKEGIKETLKWLNNEQQHQ